MLTSEKWRCRQRESSHPGSRRAGSNSKGDARMITVAGVFRTPEDAGRAGRDLRLNGIRGINLIAPDNAEQTGAVPASPAEQPGMGQTLGGVVGGALGIAGGFEIGTAAASLVLPGVGPVVATGIIAATLLGAGGAIGGAAAG